MALSWIFSAVNKNQKKTFKFFEIIYEQQLFIQNFYIMMHHVFFNNSKSYKMFIEAQNKHYKECLIFEALNTLKKVKKVCCKSQITL